MGLAFYSSLNTMVCYRGTKYNNVIYLKKKKKDETEFRVITRYKYRSR